MSEYMTESDPILNVLARSLFDEQLTEMSSVTGSRDKRGSQIFKKGVV